MLPGFKNIPAQSSITVKEFGGINTTESYKVGELINCTNIVSSSKPALATRKKRRLASECNGTINGAGSYNGVFYTFYTPETNDLYLHFKGNDYIFTKFSNYPDVTAKRRFAALENCITVIPDNIIFHTDSCTFEPVDITQTVAFADAKEKFNVETNGIPTMDFASKNALGFLSHNSIEAASAKYYSGGQVLDFYFFEYNNFIKEGDVVNIKLDVVATNATAGDEYSNYYNKMKTGFSAKVKSVERISHKSNLGYVNENISLIFDDNTIDMGGYDEVYFKNIVIERKMPSAKDITSFNNRLWAVSKNRVYASKLGEADEWNDFSVDSYGTLPTSCFSAAAGSEGDFTAIIPHGNFIYALKENYIHKIYGDTPDEFAISGMEAPGLVGNPDTACVCGVNLMYASHRGVYALRDGYPRIVSEKIGEINPVCAASCGNKYYIVCSKGLSRVIYVYDIDRDMWTMENCAPDGDNLCTFGKNLYYSTGGKLICLVGDEGDEYEKNTSWDFCLRFDSGYFSPGTSIRAIAGIALGENASFTVRALYDDDTRGAICGFCFDETANGSANLRLPIKRDLGFYLVFKGIGDFTLKNIKFNYYKSDME